MNQEVPVTRLLPAATSPLKADVYETAGGETYVIEIPVPGLKPDEICIEASVDSVTVHARPQQADDGRKYLQREHSIEPMSRIFEFAMDLDTDNVRAALESGILKIRAPKAVAARPRVIRVGQSA
jgi:HSP20 family protein